MTIRPYTAADFDAARQLIVELQEVERTIDPRLRAGESMANPYWEHVLQRCRVANGQVFVAVSDGVVVGLVAVLAAEPFTELDDPPGTYGLVTDLAVLATHRGRGIGTALLERAEAFARGKGATELRIGVLAANVVARRLYADRGFRPHLEILVKSLG